MNMSQDNARVNAPQEKVNNVGLSSTLGSPNAGGEGMTVALDMDRRRRFDKLEMEDLLPRKRRSSLFNRLVNGIYEPQNMGMRAHLNKKATAQATEIPIVPRDNREFLVPKKSRHKNTTIQPSNRVIVSENTAEVQPDPYVAYKSTPIHQLRFPESLVLAIQKNACNWRAKQHSAHSVFIVLRFIGDSLKDTHIFESLSDATADALHLVAYKHPELFALTRDKNDDGNEVKVEESERVSAALKRITAPPVSRMIRPRPKKRRRVVPEISSSSVTEGAKGETPLFLIKDEDPERPPPPRIPEPQPQPELDQQGGRLNRDTPEPTYVYWGKYTVNQSGLKMEARRHDRVVVNVHVRLNNKRKPTRK